MRKPNDASIAAPARSLAQLYALWDQLADVPVGYDGPDVDCIEEQFLHFPEGTHREDIWHWFEDQHDQFIVGEVMSGVRRSDVDPAPDFSR